MTRNKLAVAALTFTGLFGAGLAHAQRNVDVQWSVTIGSPVRVQIAPPWQPAVVFVPPARHVAPVRYVTPVRRDADRDGIPDRFDRLYNPPWDRDGDGIPNRRDRHDNRQHDRNHNGVADWREVSRGR